MKNKKNIIRTICNGLYGERGRGETLQENTRLTTMLVLVRVFR